MNPHMKFKENDYIMHRSYEGITILHINLTWTDLTYSFDIIADTFDAKLDPGRHDCNTIDKAYNRMTDDEIRMVKLLYE